MSKAIFSLVFLFVGILIGVYFSSAKLDKIDDSGLYFAQCGPDRFNGTVEKKKGKFYTLDGKSIWIPYKECSIVLVDKVKVSVVQPE